MKYMLMMNTPAGGPYQIARWPQQDIQAHIAFMKDFAKALQASGELVAIPANAPASPPKPRTAQISAMMANISVQPSMT